MGRQFTGKRVLVTGGARGIGYGIAERFLQLGAKVYIIDIRTEELEKAKEKLHEYGDRVVYDTIDLNELLLIPSVVQSAIDHWGGLDILINNAGIATRESFIDIPLERWLTIMNVNLNSVFLISQMVAKDMIARNIAGSIVNMSSKNGLKGSNQLAHYNASKGAIVLLTESMAVELAPHNIRVNAVAPGNIETPLDQELKVKEGLPDISAKNPSKRSGTIAEVVNVFTFLASDEASFVNGSTYVVDGGHLANASDV